MVVGLTGANAAGKGEVAAYLRGRGFRVHSLSDIVREEAARRGRPPEREHLIRIGTELRRQGGAGVLAERILPRLGQRDVVDSIRNPGEVAALRGRPDFVLLGLRAPEELRFARAVARQRAGDPESLGEFRERERQENTADPAAQQLEATLALADRVIDNDGDLAALHRAVELWLRALDPAGPSTSAG
jgi:dephospho-CoA kinase